MLFSPLTENGEYLYYRRITKPLQGDISVIEVGCNRVSQTHYRVLKRNLFIIHYIISGKGEFSGEGFDKSCGYLVRPDDLEVHKADKNDPYESCWIMLRGAGVPELLRRCGLPEYGGVFNFDKNDAAAKILKRVIFDIEPHNDFEEVALMQSAFYELLALHAESATDAVSPSCLKAQSVKNYIKDNYHQPIKISELAEKYNFTRSYLYSFFKKEYGVSPKEYLLNYRIDKAKQLLADTAVSLTVKEVAFAVGFEDPLYFSRVFHKKNGVSPTKFKNLSKS